MADVEEDSGSTEKTVPQISGCSRAAILLMALGEDEASSILKYMEPGEVQSIGEAMTSITSVSQEQIGNTLDHFVDRIGKESSLGFGSADYFKSTLTKAVGKDKATSVISRIDAGSEQKGLEALQWMDARVVTKLICDEHPQFIATVLSQLPREQAGEVLNRLPSELHADVIIRITQLDEIHPAALVELDEIIQQVFENNAEVELSGIGGVRVASEILNGVSKEAEESIFETIESLDNELCEKIREGMFIFENLLTLDDRGMQSLLREVSSEHLILALKGSSAEIQTKIFKNMSERAALLLKDDLDAKGPVKLSDVENSQRDILKTAHQLAEDGKIALSSKGDDFV